MRNLGGAIGLALVTTLLNHRMWQHSQNISESTRLSNPAIHEMIAQSTNANSALSLKLLALQASKQSSVMSFSDMYLLLSLSIVFALLLVPLITKPQQINTTEMGH